MPLLEEFFLLCFLLVEVILRKYVLYARAYTVDKWAIIGLIFR